MAKRAQSDSPKSVRTEVTERLRSQASEAYLFLKQEHAVLEDGELIVEGLPSILITFKGGNIYYGRVLKEELIRIGAVRQLTGKRGNKTIWMLSAEYPLLDELSPLLPNLLLPEAHAILHLRINSNQLFRGLLTKEGGLDSKGNIQRKVNELDRAINHLRAIIKDALLQKRSAQAFLDNWDQLKNCMLDGARR